MRKFRGWVSVVVLFALPVAACGGVGGRVEVGQGTSAAAARSSGVPGDDHRPPGRAGERPQDLDGAGPTSIVQLGDSIASGEGTLYGYRYDPHTRTWTGGDVNAPWPPPYPLCHDSPDAYGNHVARYFGATFTQFACTGATFANGISATQTSGRETLRPAQFGNWATQSELNEAYDAARPDLVLVTLGADDLQFVSIVEACIENGYAYAFGLASLECTAGNPGATIQADFFDHLPTLRQNYTTLVDWIAARAAANGAPVPKVVFTTYANPLPAVASTCPDMSWLYPDQVVYLSTLVDQLGAFIVESITGLGRADVAVADVAGAYTPNGVSHIWCSEDPWSYGLSIYKLSEPTSLWSQAPFHPTPAGQESLATHVIPTVKALFG